MVGFPCGFLILRWATYAGLAVGGLAALALLVRRWRAGGVRMLVFALVVAGVAAGVPLYLFQQARTLPPINDITTDTNDPPRFAAMLARRADAPVPAHHSGEATARAQRAAYPDIAPLVVEVDARRAFAAALAVAKDMHWEIVAADAGAGRIEATAITPWFGFADDVVIRVGAVERGARIDVRSVSRIGKGDLGANARRVRAFLARLRERLGVPG
jgi:uncharacterized protein (DUF1499 family)